jgi:hypothetical protein
MTEPGSPLGRWRTGFHPRAEGLRVRSLGRVHLQLGEALRLEMADDRPGEEETVHVQYYIATELGPWAVWLTSPRAEVAASESSLQVLTPPFARD